MKKYLCVMLLIISQCYASIDDGNLSNGKICISSKDVLIGDNGIFAKINGEVTQVPNLHFDENEFSVFEIEDKYAWFCTTCQKHRVRRPCYICGKDGPENPWK